VIDKFHVAKMANEALKKVRVSLRESLPPNQRRGLMHDRRVLLRCEDDLTGEEVLLLSGWLRSYPELGTTHRLKRQFLKIYDAKSKDQALAHYVAWEQDVDAEARAAFFKLIRAWRNWPPHILAYFDHPVTNAHTESLNSHIHVVNRLGRGYNLEALMAKILFAEGAFKTVRPKFVKRRDGEMVGTQELLRSFDRLARIPSSPTSSMRSQCWLRFACSPATRTAPSAGVPGCRPRRPRRRNLSTRRPAIHRRGTRWTRQLLAHPPARQRPVRREASTATAATLDPRLPPPQRPGPSSRKAAAPRPVRWSRRASSIAGRRRPNPTRRSPSGCASPRPRSPSISAC